MSDRHRQWQEIKANYLRQIKKCLADVDHPQRLEILANVSEHLDNKYAELSAAQQSWEGYQQIITEMGPPQEYAELLEEEKPSAAKSTSGVNTFLAVVFVIVLIIVGGYLIYNTEKAVPVEPPAEPYVESVTVQVREVAGSELAEQLQGRWVTVDFVRKIDYFIPGQKQWTGEFFLKGLAFYEDGTTSGPWEWNEEYLRHTGSQILSHITIRQIQDLMYLFIEWNSGDVTTHEEEPWYYVLKKQNEG